MTMLRRELALALVPAVGLVTALAWAEPKQGSNDGCIDLNSHVEIDASQPQGYRCDCNAGWIGIAGGPFGSECVPDPGGTLPVPTPPPSTPGHGPPRRGACTECRARKAACKRDANRRRDQCVSTAAPLTAKELCERGQQIVGGLSAPPVPPFIEEQREDRSKCLEWEQDCTPTRERCTARERGRDPRDLGGIDCTIHPPRCTRSCVRFGTKIERRATEVCVSDWLHGVIDITGGSVTINSAGALGGGISLSTRTGLLGYCKDQYLHDTLACNGADYSCATECGR